jgi:hypothetical protein
LQGRIGAAGVALAVATSIKTLPILLLPLIVLSLGRRSIRFLTAFSIAIAVLFVPTLVLAGPVMLHNIFGYRGFTGEWGIPSLFLVLDWQLQSGPWFEIARVYAQGGTWLALAALVLIPCAARLRRPLDETDVARGTPLLLATLLVLAPGFGVQYLLWPIALLPLIAGRYVYLAVMGVVSTFLFYTYTLWSGGFPWWFANANDHYPGKPPYLLFALAVWATLGCAAVDGAIRFLRRTRARTTIAGTTRTDLD